MPMIRALAALAAAVALAAPAAAQEGVLAKQSENGFDGTIARLEIALNERDIHIFDKLDHAAGSASVGQSLRPTTLLVFGDPAMGSPLMAESQGFGLDLPMKALVYEDAGGRVWIAYNDMAFLAERHGVDPQSEAVTRVAGGLEAITDQAAAAD